MARNPTPVRVPDVGDSDTPPWVEQLRQALTILAGNQSKMVEAIGSLRMRLDASDARLLSVKESVLETGATVRRVEEALSARSEGGGLRAVMEELQGLNVSLDALTASNRELNAAIGTLTGKVDDAALNAAVDAAAIVSGGGAPLPMPGSGPLLPGTAAVRRVGNPQSGTGANAMPRVRRYGDEE